MQTLFEDTHLAYSKEYEKQKKFVQISNAFGIFTFGLLILAALCELPNKTIEILITNTPANILRNILNSHSSGSTIDSLFTILLNKYPNVIFLLLNTVNINNPAAPFYLKTNYYKALAEFLLEHRNSLNENEATAVTIYKSLTLNDSDLICQIISKIQENPKNLVGNYLLLNKMFENDAVKTVIEFGKKNKILKRDSTCYAIKQTETKQTMSVLFGNFFGSRPKIPIKSNVVAINKKYGERLPILSKIKDCSDYLIQLNQHNSHILVVFDELLKRIYNVYHKKTTDDTYSTLYQKADESVQRSFSQHHKKNALDELFIFGFFLFAIFCEIHDEVMQALIEKASPTILLKLFVDWHHAEVRCTQKTFGVPLLLYFMKIFHADTVIQLLDKLPPSQDISSLCQFFEEDCSKKLALFSLQNQHLLAQHPKASQLLHQSIHLPFQVVYELILETQKNQKELLRNYPLLDRMYQKCQPAACLTKFATEDEEVKYFMETCGNKKFNFVQLFEAQKSGSLKTLCKMENQSQHQTVASNAIFHRCIPSTPPLTHQPNTQEVHSTFALNKSKK